MANPNSLNIIHLHGLIDAKTFKQAQFCAKKLALSASKYFGEPIIEKMFEFEWEYFMEQQKQKHRGEMWVYKETELIFINEELIGGYKDLLTWAENNIAFEDQWIQPLYSVLTEEDYKNQLKDKNHDLMYMYISIDDQPEGHFLIELFTDIVPKTCENFKALCFKHVTPTGLPLSYVDTIFHRIVPNGWIQGGDVIKGNGSDGRSIYGDVFEDENFAIPHNKRGILGMSNHGRHTNNSQFYITLTATPWMNYKYVAFGQLLEGTDLLKKMEEQLTINEHPVNNIVITKCEILNFEETLEDNLPDFSIGLEEDDKKDEEDQEENEQIQDGTENELTEYENSNANYSESGSTQKENTQQDTQDENIKDELAPAENIYGSESSEKETMQEGTQDENIKEEAEVNISGNASTKKETIQEGVQDELPPAENISENASAKKETVQEETTKDENVKDELLPAENISENASTKKEALQDGVQEKLPPAENISEIESTKKEALQDGVQDELPPGENISENESTKKEALQDGVQEKLPPAENISEIESTKNEALQDGVQDDLPPAENISEIESTKKETVQEEETQDKNIKDELLPEENISGNASSKKETVQEGIQDENTKDNLPPAENISENASTEKETIQEGTQDENIKDELLKEKEVIETE